jgi:predicted metal-binding protein
MGLEWKYGANRTTAKIEYMNLKDSNVVDLNQLVDKAKELGAAAAGAVKTSDIQFSEEFRKLCEQNSCGKYGTNWMCPPAIESFEEVKAKVLQFSEGVIIQSIYKLEDSFDFEGMVKAGEIHEKTFRSILEYIQLNIDSSKVLALNVGDCEFCKKCTYQDGEICRFPDKAIASVESYCIDVNALLGSGGLAYNNGPNTVSYVGLFLF